ncbi:hypothetical protein HNY73_005397 [Argiope bruennichi]|uniref:Transmembrane protein n=1 Tax=Argiope bruennichi TaxID=94029 RepID=A0A8T0FLU3_ARGBR|nr:hypothetical protein HNY73_005397 [Argiope bruennichi]
MELTTWLYSLSHLAALTVGKCYKMWSVVWRQTCCSDWRNFENVADMFCGSEQNVCDVVWRNRNLVGGVGCGVCVCVCVCGGIEIWYGGVCVEESNLVGGGVCGGIEICGGVLCGGIEIWTDKRLEQIPFGIREEGKEFHSLCA